MSKRTNSSDEVPPAKRSRRPAGFRLTRTAPVPSQPSSSANSSLFVTITQPDKRRGILQAQNRVLPSTHGRTSSSSSSPSPSEAQLPIEPIEPNTEIPDEPELIPQAQQQTVKPKRKRNMTNAVHYPLQFSYLN
jgi:hypothetical protein